MRQGTHNPKDRAGRVVAIREAAITPPARRPSTVSDVKTSEEGRGTGAYRVDRAYG